MRRIQEKLEFERTGSDGGPTKGYALWSTRDAWRQTGAQRQITPSETIGVEMWRRDAAVSGLGLVVRPWHLSAIGALTRAAPP